MSLPFLAKMWKCNFRVSILPHSSLYFGCLSNWKISLGRGVGKVWKSSSSFCKLVWPTSVEGQFPGWGGFFRLLCQYVHSYCVLDEYLAQSISNSCDMFCHVYSPVVCIVIWDNNQNRGIFWHSFKKKTNSIFTRTAFQCIKVNS